MSEAVAASSTEHKALLDEANERFAWVQENDRDNRENYKADLAFVYTPGAQWPDDVKTLRRGWKEPCLEFNQLKQFVAQVVNDQLQNRPGVRVHPAGGEASKDVAEILQGLVRAIEYESKADDTYKNAFRLAVAGGRGWWRITSEYEEQDGFNQVLRIKPILDSNTVYADTEYTQPDGSDRNWAFVVQAYTKVEFLRKWPNHDPLSWDQMPTYWSTGKDMIFVADYYRRVCKKRTKVLMTDGNSGWKDEMPTPPAGVTIAREREVEDYSVEWYTIAGGQQVLETYEWPGSVIPLVCVAGEDLILEGRRVYQGLTRHARDAQSMLNFAMTQQAIQLALQPRAPWVMAEGQNEGYEAMWREANTRNWSALIYKPTTLDGQLAPPPQRTEPAKFSEGWDRTVVSMLGMIKSTIGMYEQSLGQKGNETSGKAITARERQGDTATFNFVNNWHMGIDLTGRILVEVIPRFYDTERIVSTIGLDETKKMVTINQNTVTAGEGEGAIQAITDNDLSKGRYAVTVEAGPSFATKRQETAERLTELVRSYPQMMEVAADIVVRAQEIPDADILADRLQMSLPPAIQKMLAQEKDGQKAPDPAVMAELTQKDQQLQQAAQTMEAMEQEIQKLKSGSEAKLQAAQMDMQVKREQAMMDADTAEREAQRQAELEAIKVEAAARQAVETAQIQAATTLQTAQIERDTAIQKALIERATKLEIADMQAAASVQIAESKPEPQKASE